MKNKLKLIDSITYELLEFVIIFFSAFLGASWALLINDSMNGIFDGAGFNLFYFGCIFLIIVLFVKAIVRFNN